MMQPAELLQYFRVLRISLKDSSVGSLCSLVLKRKLYVSQGQEFKFGNSRLSAAREHDRSETKYLPQSMASAGWSQYI